MRTNQQASCELRADAEALRVAEIAFRSILEDGSNRTDREARRLWRLFSRFEDLDSDIQSRPKVYRAFPENQLFADTLLWEYRFVLENWRHMTAGEGRALFERIRKRGVGIGEAHLGDTYRCAFDPTHRDTVNEAGLRRAATLDWRIACWAVIKKHERRLSQLAVRLHIDARALRTLRRGDVDHSTRGAVLEFLGSLRARLKEEAFARSEHRHAAEHQALHVRATHSDDFASVRWFGAQYSFTTSQQRALVRFLWDQWEKGAPNVAESSIAEAIGSNADRVEVGKILRDRTGGRSVPHPAYKTMIQRTDRGCWALVEPAGK